MFIVAKARFEVGYGLLLEVEAIPHKGDSCSGTTMVQGLTFFITL